MASVVVQPNLASAQPTFRKMAYQLDELDLGDEGVRSVTQKVWHVIDNDISILILGETGTGKKLLANAIHQFSQRRDHPFIAIKCASIPEQLIESELFVCRRPKTDLFATMQPDVGLVRRFEQAETSSNSRLVGFSFEYHVEQRMG